MRSAFIRLSLLAGVAAIGCSSATPSVPTGATPTPTPGILTRLDPSGVVEETETYVIHRLPKEQYIRLDDRHIRHVAIPIPVEFFKEDEKYYYIQTPKVIPEEAEMRKSAGAGSSVSVAPVVPTPVPSSTSPAPPPLADFENLSPARVAGRLKLQKVVSSGLPDGGMWRASFVLADINRDGIIDVVAPPARIGDGSLHIWRGSGDGKFTEWPLTFTEDGQPVNFSIDYGAVAVGDIDRDGNLDVVSASHGYGLVSLFGDGKGSFRVVRAGLPAKGFSSQAITLIDADGDRKLDIVAGLDIGQQESISRGADQVRLYVYRGAKGWQLKPDGIVGGVLSNTIHAWDYDRDGKSDLLCGSHQFGALALVWRGTGDGRFDPVTFPQMEAYAVHPAAEVGTFGRRRSPAFADAYRLFTNTPALARATGITVYSFEDGSWTRHRVWREKEGESALFALAMGDLNGDGLDDVAFADTRAKRLRIFFQQPDASFVEMAEREEPALDSPGQCIRIADLDGDGRLDLVVAKTVTSAASTEPGGWDVYMNRAK